MNDERYRFLVDWFDSTIKVTRRFLLSFFPTDGGIEMYDLTCKKLFLRRIPCDTVDISDLFVGSVINVLSRQLTIVDFGDQFTARKFAREVESGILIITDSGFSNLGSIIRVLEKNELSIYRGKMIDIVKSDFSSSSLYEYLSKQFAVFDVRGLSSKSNVRKLVHPDSPIDMPVKMDLGDLAKHCVTPKDIKSVDEELRIFFPSSREVHCNTTLYKHSTCCIIKPHTVREKIMGKIIQDIIDAGFSITALEVVHFTQATAAEFYDVYKGVVAEYKGMVSQLIAGASIALEITRQGSPNAFSEFRTFVGPSDPEIAKNIRPSTLRATYGTDKIKNAVHCTDLQEDAISELEYVFRILSA